MAILDKYKWISHCFKLGKEKTHDKLNKIFARGKIDRATIEELEELLITSDVGVTATKALINKLTTVKLGEENSIEYVKKILADEMVKIIEPVAKPIDFNSDNNLHVMLFCGVNGNGKTTTLGKLAYKYKALGKSVVIAACDTFRAAANEQLEIWGKYAECEIIKGEENSDPASIAYKAMDYAKQNGSDIVLIDTSGRIHTYKNFMEELDKIIRIIKKHDDNAPHNIILVLDGTTGQNAVNQVRVFQEMTGVNGLILTKLDGTAKGGIVVSLAKQFPEVALHYVGFGEGAEDIEEFSAREFVNDMLGIEQ
ncbi:MAG: signal recognition particle-docking protein FtsY [Rickettsiaceae bacterium H1]|nr:signal recognition particle-docking protein FtsY [Rickettsiaceae bacterium H1]